MNPKISVIVPVYNAAASLETALRSVACQTLDEIEVICINDGSRDNSLQILNDFAARDSRFMVHSNAENVGVALSRNKGMALAKGEYIGFLDNDDRMEAEMCELLYREAASSNYDMVRCDVKVHEGGKITSAAYTPRFPKGSEELRNEMLSLLLYQFADDPQPTGLWMSGVWNKIYKKELLDRYGIVYLSEREFPNEDFLFNLNVLLKSSRVSFVSRPLYHHYNHPSSLGSASYHYKQYIRIIRTCELAGQKLQEELQVPEEAMERLYYRACSHLPLGLINEWKRNPHGKKGAWRAIRRTCNHPFSRNALHRIKTGRMLPASGNGLYPLFSGCVLRLLKILC